MNTKNRSKSSKVCSECGKPATHLKDQACSFLDGEKFNFHSVYLENKLFYCSKCVPYGHSYWTISQHPDKFN